MFLKSLNVKGFKSFADSTTLEFEPGVTVVVGPNGSGKSNVVDAVAWVLGAQGPRTLRSTKMDDVIFAGSPNRPALGRAEVSLTIDNSAGLLPIDFSEVTITRTLFRTGESEYAINRVPCRLLDIQELLSDTGVGRQQHVIVAQGNLDAVLNARPEERRLVIEEAAGILKFRRRKERAERRLESTEASLVRLQDLLREVRRQLRPLEKQADAARRHDDLAAELHAVRRYLYATELGVNEAKLSSARRARTDAGVAEDEVRAALQRLDVDLLAAESTANREAEQSRGEDLHEAVSQAEALRARSGGLVAVLDERRRSVGQQLGASVDLDVISSLEAEAAALAQRLTATDEEAKSLKPRLEEVAAAAVALEHDAQHVGSERHGDGAVAIDQAAEARAELVALRSADERSMAESDRLASSIRSIDQRLGRIAAELDRLRIVRDEATAAARAGDERIRTACEAESASNRAVAEADVKQRDAAAAHHRAAAKADAMSEALAQARARAGLERLTGVDGVVGSLVELVEVDEGYEQAFEAAAGEVLAAVVVDGHDAARRGLAELSRSAAAGAVFALPNANESDVPAPPHITAAPAVRLRSRVRGWLPGINALLDRLLSSAVVVDSGWEAALDVAIECPDAVVVTRSGDRFSGGLWRAGAGGAGVTAAAVTEARRKEEETEASARRAEEELSAAKRAAENEKAQLIQAQAAADANASRLASATDGVERLGAELEEATQERFVAASQQSDLDERSERELARAAQLEQLLPELEHRAEAEAANVAAERASQARIAQRRAELADLRHDLDVRTASLEERRALTTRRLHEVEERLQRNIADRESAATRRLQLESTVVAIDRLAALVRKHRVGLDGALVRLRKAREARAEADRTRIDRLDQLRRQRAAAERQLAEVRERASRAEIEETEARMRLEALTDSIRRDLECEPESIRGSTSPELPPGTSAISRATELERELRIMGPINPLALEEHTALQQRHEFLESQLEDVKSARRDLTKVIRAIDAEIVEVFRAAYADVADNFERLFSTLFPGGQGRLRLTEPEHPLETGIEVEARPSGKHVRRLSLLSGGERSLTALAFLFAVFRSRPSPFYLLDEVEAALDDVNLHRFLDLIHEFRDEAQLLIVTHQKRTMEAADCLYGVTMPPGGSSRVVSERVTAAAPI